MASLKVEPELGEEILPEEPQDTTRLSTKLLVAIGVFAVAALAMIFFSLGGPSEISEISTDGENARQEQNATVIVDAETGTDDSGDTDDSDDPLSNFTSEAPIAAEEESAPQPAPADTPALFRSYGNPQIALSLADTEVGGRAIDAASLLVRFPHGGTLDAVRPFIIYRPGDVGNDSYYHKGDGSTVEFRLEADDGTPEHNPSGEVLARTGNVIGGPEIYKGSGPDDARVGGDPDDDGNFRKFSFIEPVRVEANTWYHLVMYNTGNDARNNFVSYDNLNSGGRPRSDAVPLFGELDFSVKYRSGGTWKDRSEQWAIGEFYFTDAMAYGNGYMEVGSVNGPDRVSNYVSPEQSVRQRFTPPNDLIVTEAHVGAMHVSGNNALTLPLTDSEGTTLWSGQAGDFPTGTPSGNDRGRTSVVTAAFRGDGSVPSLALTGGQTYFLEVGSTGGTHTVTGLRDGSVSWNFSPDTSVVGQAELRVGSGDWAGWTLAANRNVRDEFDISFYLVTENCARCG
jgi:hypothetical protein